MINFINYDWNIYPNCWFEIKELKAAALTSDAFNDCETETHKQVTYAQIKPTVANLNSNTVLIL